MAKHTYDFPKADHTVDPVVFGYEPETASLKILLIRRGRKGEPFFESWALPGGFLDMDETLEKAAHRELCEETGLKVAHLEQLATFSRVDRDPRGRVLSTAFLALVRPTDVKGMDDATEARWFDVTKLPPLAFDHAEIIGVGLQRLRSKVRWEPIGINLLPERFAIPDLRRLYEAILGYPIDSRNFRSRVGKLDVLVEDITEMRHGQRTQLYRFSPRKYRTMQKQGYVFQI